MRPINAFRRTMPPTQGPTTTTQHVICLAVAGRVEVVQAPAEALLAQPLLTLCAKHPDGLRYAKDETSGRRFVVLGHRHANSGRVVYEIAADDVDGNGTILGRRVA